MGDFTTNPFAGITTKKPSEGGNYIRPGLHTLRLLAIKLVNGQDGNYFVTEHEVIDSKPGTNLAGQAVAPHTVGETVTWMVNFAHQPALGNIRAFVAALLGVPVEDVDEAACMGVADVSNPCGGTVLKCEGTEIRTKKKGSAFTKCFWRAA